MVVGKTEDETQSLAQAVTVETWINVETEVTVTAGRVTVVSTHDELAVGKEGSVLLIDGTGLPLLGARVGKVSVPVRRPSVLDRGDVELADGVGKPVVAPVPIGTVELAEFTGVPLLGLAEGEKLPVLSPWVLESGVVELADGAVPVPAGSVELTPE